MKKSIKVVLLSAVLALGMTGCGEMITVKKQDNGSMAYMMNYEVELPVNKGARYRGYKIHRYSMDFKELNGIVTVKVKHRITFTMGSGTPNNGSGSLTNWMPSRFYHQPVSFDIVGLSARKHIAKVQACSLLIDSCSETIKTQYTKKDFVKFFKNTKNAEVKIRFGNEARTIVVPSMNKIHKYVNCLENKASCSK